MQKALVEDKRIQLCCDIDDNNNNNGSADNEHDGTFILYIHVKQSVKHIFSKSLAASMSQKRMKAI